MADASIQQDIEQWLVLIGPRETASVRWDSEIGWVIDLLVKRCPTLSFYYYTGTQLYIFVGHHVTFAMCGTMFKLGQRLHRSP